MVKHLGGDIIDRSEKKYSCELVSKSVTEIELLESANTKAGWMVTKEKELITVNFIVF